PGLRAHGRCRDVRRCASPEVRTRIVSELCHVPPRNRGATPSSTGTPRSTTLLREGADRECVGMIQCASARVKGINFQACAFNHSDISPIEWNQQLTGRGRALQKQTV